MFEINGGHPLPYCVILKYIVGGNVPGIVIVLGDEQPPATLFQLTLSVDQLTKIVPQGPLIVKYNKNVLPLLFNTVCKIGAVQFDVCVTVGVGVIKQGFGVVVGVGVGVSLIILQGYFETQ